MGSGVELKPVLKIGHTRINERNSKFEIRAKHPVWDQSEMKMLNSKLETLNSKQTQMSKHKTQNCMT